jgi:putative membrane protein
MKPIASQLGLNPPDDVGMMHKGMEKKLQGKSGAEFDKAYMEMMVKDHQKDLSEFRKEASSGKSPAVKDAASQGAPIIEEHLKMAQQIAQTVGGSGASGSASASSGGSSPQ